MKEGEEFVYSYDIEDPDGFGWDPFYMDMSKLPDQSK